MPDPGDAGPRIVPFGEAALLVVLGDRLDLRLNADAQRLASRLRDLLASGAPLGPPIPAHASVLVPFDPLTADEAAVRKILVDALATARAAPAVFAVPPRPEAPPAVLRVRYGGSAGPDLAGVAARLGRSEADVVDLHSSGEYRVLALGFVPGFAYLGPLPEELWLPRRATPRVRVPAGSVAIAGDQTGIYPAPTPGGWHLLGRTDAVLWDPRRDPPSLLAPGQRVRFEAA